MRRRLSKQKFFPSGEDVYSESFREKLIEDAKLPIEEDGFISEHEGGIR